jgi:hypothetical protein
MDLVGIGDPVDQWEAMTAVARTADEGTWDSIWLYVLPHHRWVSLQHCTSNNIRETMGGGFTRGSTGMDLASNRTYAYQMAARKVPITALAAFVSSLRPATHSLPCSLPGGP